MKQILWILSAPFLTLALALDLNPWYTEPVSEKNAPVLLLEAKKEFVGVLVNPPPAVVEAVGKALKRGVKADLVCVGPTCLPLSVWRGVLAVVDQGGDGPPNGSVAVDGDAFVLVLDPKGWYRGRGWAVWNVRETLMTTVRKVKGAYAEYRRRVGR